MRRSHHNPTVETSHVLARCAPRAQLKVTVKVLCLQVGDQLLQRVPSALHGSRRSLPPTPENSYSEMKRAEQSPGCLAPGAPLQTGGQPPEAWHVERKWVARSRGVALSPCSVRTDTFSPTSLTDPPGWEQHPVKELLRIPGNATQPHEGPRSKAEARLGRYKMQTLFRTDHSEAPWR